ncbi:phage tail tape measure protein [Serratia ureilytica]|uniref:phage tail tape measure protein n=1 Tax=Serratia ureilytica TaxID=300181 RepID=UPI0018D681B7|nr:phage tail tape measure protein [Serratia ureilytica]MBH2945052.1 phage tail tape measure protein [Serratia ureilytica]
MSNSRQELESQNEIVIGLQAIAKQSKELMRQLRRPTGDKNLYNSLGQDIQRAEKKVKHLRRQENDIDAFQKTNQSLAETNKLLAASRKKSAALAMLTKDREPSQRSRFMNKEIAQVAETINALEKKRDLLAAIDKSQRHHLTQQGINLQSLGNERKNLRDGRINAGAAIVTLKEQRQSIAQERYRSAQAGNQARLDKLEKLRNTSSAGFSVAKSAAIGGANLLAPGIEFEKQLSQLRAQLNLGKSDPQLTALEQQARGMSQSGYTPDQALQAQTALAKQGLNVKEILTASPAALTLSAATGSSVNETAATMTEMQRSFNLGPDQFDRIADVLALASNQYGMDVRAVGAAMKSKATTGADIFSAAQQIAPLGREKLQANQVAGSAQHLVTVKGDNIEGDIQKLFASWDSLRINLFTGQNAALRELTQTATEWLVKLNTWITNNPALAGTLLQVAGGLTLLLGGLSGVSLVATQVLSGFSIISGAILKAGQAMMWLGRIAMANPLLAIVGLVALAAFTLIENWDKVGPFFSHLWEQISAGCEALKNYISDTIDGWIKQLTSLTEYLPDWMQFGDKSGTSGNAENGSAWFAGKFDRGGDIPAGQFGIVGENGPELVSGPVQVTGRRHTAAMSAALLSLSAPVMPASPVAGSPVTQIQVPSVTINITAGAGQNEQDIGREVARQFELLAHRQAANARSRMS